MQPELMLFDEVTSALDPQLVGRCWRIKELKDSGMTILMATHEMGFARDVADRVCYLADGQVWSRGRRGSSSTARTIPGPRSSWRGFGRGPDRRRMAGFASCMLLILMT